MMWVDVLVLVMLILSAIGGIIDGGIKHFFSILGFLIAIAVTGALYPVAAGMLSFLPPNWGNFAGFFVTLGIISIAMSLVFTLPRKLLQSAWKEGIILRLMGGALNALNAATGIVLLATVLRAYPVQDWLRDALLGAGMVQSLISNLGFIQGLLPEVLRQAPAAPTVLSGLLLPL